MGIEAGYDIMAHSNACHQRRQRLYLFGRYDYYDAMFKTVSSMADEKEWGRQKITLGFNYYPIKQIVIKGEWSNRMFDKAYNNEPTLSLGVAYYGMFHL